MRRLLDLAKTLERSPVGPHFEQPNPGISMGWSGSESTAASGPDGANQGSLGCGTYGRQHATSGQCSAGGPNPLGHADAPRESGHLHSKSY